MILLQLISINKQSITAFLAIMLLPVYMAAHTSGMGQVHTEVNQFTGEMFNQPIFFENADVLSENDQSVWVRTSSNSLTFNIQRSVIYSEMVTSPLVAYGKRRTVLLLPLR